MRKALTEHAYLVHENFTIWGNSSNPDFRSQCPKRLILPSCLLRNLSIKQWLFVFPQAVLRE